MENALIEAGEIHKALCDAHVAERDHLICFISQEDKHYKEQSRQSGDSVQISPFVSSSALSKRLSITPTLVPDSSFSLVPTTIHLF